jgi:hypothetical protein
MTPIDQIWNHYIALLEEDFSVSDLVTIKTRLERRVSDLEQSIEDRKKRLEALRESGKGDTKATRWIRDRVDSALEEVYQLQRKALVIEKVILKIADPETEGTFPPPKADELEEEIRGKNDQESSIPPDMSASELSQYADTTHVQRRRIEVESMLDESKPNWVDEEVPREVKEEIAEGYSISYHTIKKDIDYLRDMRRS